MLLLCYGLVQRGRTAEPLRQSRRVRGPVDSPCETASAGLETFVSIAKRLPSPEIYDVVEGYMKISMECAEIFKLMDGERKPDSEVSWPWVLQLNAWQRASGSGEERPEKCLAV